MNERENRVLIGNSFPFPLIQRDVYVRVKSLFHFHQAIEGRDLHSFWGHANTLSAVNAFAGGDLTPRTERPALSLSEKELPVLNGFEFDVCWVLSPVYARTFRAEVGKEVPSECITGWRVLKMEWQDVQHPIRKEMNNGATR